MGLRLRWKGWNDSYAIRAIRGDLGRTTAAIRIPPGSIRKTNCCVVVDQSWSFASVGSEVAAEVHRYCFDDLDNHVHRVHSDDVPAPYAHNLEAEMLPNARKICEAVRACTYNA